MAERVVITGLGLEVPGVPSAADLLALPSGGISRAEFVAHTKLGRKGLLFKERATRLALCAAQSALADAGLPITAAQQLEPEEIGVVVSSNLGNLETVHKVVGEIHAGGVKATSPLDLPNASSNVVASSLAIRFGCKAANLMLCNGATGGVDALHLASNLIRAGRARRVLAVGVETDEPAAQRLLQVSGPGVLGDGAGCVVLEAESAARERGATVHAAVGRYGHTHGMQLEFSAGPALAGLSGPPDLWLTPGRGHAGVPEAIAPVLAGWGERAPEQIDLCASLGEMYGALGVLQAIAACVWLRARPGRSALITSGAIWNDGAASLGLTKGQLDAGSV